MIMSTVLLTLLRKRKKEKKTMFKNLSEATKAKFGKELEEHKNV